MNIYYGDLMDSKNKESRSFLQVNSCGSTSAAETEHTVIRSSGRVDYHIFYLAEGKADIHENGEVIHLSAGDFVLYPPKAPQKYTRLPYSKDYWVHFNGFQTAEILNDACLVFGISRAEESIGIRKLFTDLITENSLKTENSVSAEKGILLTLLYTLGRTAAGKGSPRQNEAVHKAVSYINENYACDFTNEFLAEKYNLSLGRFEHIFKAETGISPSAYRQKLRIENAKSLLSSTSLSVLEISMLSGFSDQLYFSRIFKRKTGVSPSEYRRLRSK